MPQSPLVVLIAPDEFKESLRARDAAIAIARGVALGAERAGVRIECDLAPLSDGGAGFVDTLVAARNGETRRDRVTGPLGEPVEAQWGLLPPGEGEREATAVVELSAAAGMALVPRDRRDPTHTTTFGVGELIARSLDAGAGTVLLGIGNSATCDAGAGMAAALGVRFLDAQGAPIARPTGADLGRIARIDAGARDARLARTRVVVACDVDNPLFGPRGAAFVFAPQKGATPEQVRTLDDGLRALAQRCAEAGIDADPDEPGSGAAGGVGFGARAFLGATSARGAVIAFDALGFDRRLLRADLLITGEGRLDAQSLGGKAPFEAARRAAEAGALCVALVGATGEGWERATRARGGPFDEVVVIADPDASLAANIKRGGANLEAHAARIVERLVRAGRL
ncbi:MAG: glycerate kinase [Phycisphaerales bacterium]|nr:MAG: glycerate kinase [Phycisphaerales bacterium]